MLKHIKRRARRFKHGRQSIFIDDFATRRIDDDGIPFSSISAAVLTADDRSLACAWQLTERYHSRQHLIQAVQ